MDKAAVARAAAAAKARGGSLVGAVVTADASGVKEKATEASQQQGATEKPLGIEEVPSAEAARKRTRPDTSAVVRPYVPEWSVLSTDSIAHLAPDRIKDVSGDLCRS